MERFKVAPGTVQETLMMPLYGRVYCDEHFPDTFPNKAAVRAAQNVDYDFKKVESSELNMVTWGSGRECCRMRQSSISKRARRRRSSISAVGWISPLTRWTTAAANGSTLICRM